MGSPQTQDLVKKAQALEAELSRVILSATDLRAGLERQALLYPVGDMALAEANHRTEAVRAVLDAVLKSVGPRAVDRKRFQELVNQESRSTPNEGAASARHAVLLTEARKVLGIKA